MRVASTIELDDNAHKALEKVADSNTLSVRFVRRARFLDGGITALRQDRPRGGRRARADAEEIARLTTQSCPSNATHWSTRSMAAMANTSPATVRRIWRAHGLKPHRFTTFKVSRDPKFVEKLEDIVGLYMNPPENGWTSTRGSTFISRPPLPPGSIWLSDFFVT